MNKFKRAAAAVMTAAMVLSLAACDEEAPVTNSGASNSSAPNSAANAVTTTPLVTTTYDTDPNVIKAAEDAASGLDNPDLKVTKRLKWMAWWDIDETTAASLNNGGALAANHLYMMTIEGRGVKAGSDTTKLLVRGSYTIA